MCLIQPYYNYISSYIVWLSLDIGQFMSLPTEIEAANGLSALGNQSRLAIFRLLVRAGEYGLPVGRIGRELDIPLSTLAHHLDRLVRTSLVRQNRLGREVYCVADFAVLQNLTEYLTEKCCEGLPEEPVSTTTATPATKELIES